MREICTGCGLTLYRGLGNVCSACGKLAPPPKPKERKDNNSGESRDMREAQLHLGG